MMDKRGDISQVEDVGGFLYKIMIIIGVFVVTFLLLRSAVVSDIDIFDAEANVLVFRLIYQKGALPYSDPVVGRTYPGIIDVEAVTDERLEEAMSFLDSSHMAARIDIMSIEGYEYGPFYVNKEYYRRWYPIAATAGSGAGSVRMLERSFYVLLRDRRTVMRSSLDLMDSWDPRRKELEERIGSDKGYEDIQLVPARLDIRMLMPES